MKINSSILNSATKFDLLDAVGKGKPLLVLRNKILMSPGIWNNKYYSRDTVLDALKNTDFNDEVCSLFLDHKDTEASKNPGN